LYPYGTQSPTYLQFNKASRVCAVRHRPKLFENGAKSLFLASSACLCVFLQHGYNELTWFKAFYHCYKILTSTQRIDCLILVSDEALVASRDLKYDSFSNRLRVIKRDATLLKSDECYKHVMNKLEVFAMTDYEKIVYFDSDSHILRIPLELFDLDVCGVEFAAPLAYWERDPCFHTSLMVVRPSFDTYLKVVSFAIKVGKGFDMDVLNQYYQHRAGTAWFTDNALILPYHYVCLTHDQKITAFVNVYNNFSFNRPICNESALLHFSIGGKPWSIIGGNLDGKTRIMYNLYNVIIKQIIQFDEVQHSVLDIPLPTF
jgi:hypothetical protein